MSLSEIAFQTFCYPGRPVVVHREALNENERRAYYYRDRPPEVLARIMNVKLLRARFYLKSLKVKGWIE